MKNKRVGTISMGIVLIGFGILILIAQINKLSAVELAVKFWPMILILIGGEVLWYSYKTKDEEDIKIRYDVFSIFIVMIILSVNIGIYGLIETGIMDLVKLKVSQEIHYYDN